MMTECLLSGDETLHITGFSTHVIRSTGSGRWKKYIPFAIMAVFGMLTAYHVVDNVKSSPPKDGLGDMSKRTEDKDLKYAKPEDSANFKKAPWNSNVVENLEHAMDWAKANKLAVEVDLTEDYEIPYEFLQCPPGYYRHVSSCYKLFSVLADINGAIDSCAIEGGSLAKIDSLAENEFVQSLLQVSVHSGIILGDSAWIGLSDMNEQDSWRWTDTDERVKYGLSLMWASGQPGARNGENCVDINVKGEWSDVGCHLGRPYVCEVHIEQCPQGYEPHMDQCYKFASSGMNVYDAMTDCASSGAHLATVHNVIENSYIVSKRDSKKDVWIGLIDSGDKMGFKWLNGESSTYFNWAADEPPTESGQTCTVMDTMGEWKHESCEAKNFAVCQGSGKSIPKPFRCPVGYNHFVNACYRVDPTPTNHTEAEKICEDEGANLVYIYNGYENMYLQEYLKLTTATEFWLGLTDFTLKGMFSWTRGGKLKYKNWTEAEPRLETCAMISADNGLWATTPCWRELGFICKKKS